MAKNIQHFWILLDCYAKSIHQKKVCWNSVLMRDDFLHNLHQILRNIFIWWVFAFKGVIHIWCQAYLEYSGLVLLEPLQLNIWGTPRTSSGMHTFSFPERCHLRTPPFRIEIQILWLLIIVPRINIIITIKMFIAITKYLTILDIQLSYLF